MPPPNWLMRGAAIELAKAITVTVTTRNHGALYPFARSACDVLTPLPAAAMLGQLFWAGLVAYLYLVGSQLYRLFNPPKCGPHTPLLYCVPPLLHQDTPLHLLVYVHTSDVQSSPAELAALSPDVAPQLLLERDLSPPTAATGPLKRPLKLPLQRLGVRSNSSRLFVHAFLFSAAHPDDAPPVGYVVAPLIRHMPARTRAAKLLLNTPVLGGGDKTSTAEAGSAAGGPSVARSYLDGGAPDGGAVDDADTTLLEIPETAGDADADDEDLNWQHGAAAPHLRPHVTLRLAHPTPSLQRSTFPGELAAYVVALDDPHLPKRRNPHAAPVPQTLVYRPLFALDDLSITRRQWRLVSRNESAPDPEMELRLEPCSLGGFSFYTQMTIALQNMQTMLALTEDDTDDIRAMVSGANLRIWALTMIISLLHTCFSYLAFKNDIGFWKMKSSLEGLSVRTFFSNLVCQTIIFAKLCDSGNVSWLILTESGLGCCLEAWKVSKIAARRGMLTPAYWRRRKAIDAPPAGTTAVSQLAKSEDALAVPKMTALEAATDEADARAMRVMLHCMWPLIAGWGIYSLLKHPHTSWTSWLIHTAGNGVYLYGFVAMCPQLYINYRLKSVAHLPWRAMAYKVFNTVIDDVFAFAIAMPWSHRLACFRDDLVFLVYLYQRWIYPVDKSRANEFGRAYEDAADKKGKTEKSGEGEPVDGEQTVTLAEKKTQ